MKPRTLENYDALVGDAVSKMVTRLNKRGDTAHDIMLALHAGFGLDVSERTVKNWLKALED